jgi:O-antigen ligase
MARATFWKQPKPWPFWVLCSFILLAFTTAGSSRADMQSLAFFRPISVLVCGYGLWGLKREHIRHYKILFGMAAAIFGLVVLHLVPLPPSIWGALPGRTLLAEVDQAAGLGAVWRPISMVPFATWNAFYALFAPLAVLLLSVQVTREQRFLLLPAFITLGLASGILGMLQVVGAPDGPLYLYKITNGDSAVGLFSNRNHQAVFLACLFPMLAVFASAGIKTVEQSRTRIGIAIAVGIVLVPLLLVTGSRGGLLAGVLGLLSIPALYRRPVITRPVKRKTRNRMTAFVAGGFAVVTLGVLTVLFARAKAIERFASAHTTDDRLDMWVPITRMVWKYFPFGSGIGSFVEVYQIDEPAEILSLQYANHAHNDWLEILMTAGAPGVALFGIAAICWASSTFRALRSNPTDSRDFRFVRLGSTLLLLLAVASIADYPVRVPSMTCLTVIAAVWMRNTNITLTNQSEK